MIAHPELHAVLRASLTPGWKIRVLGDPDRKILATAEAPVVLDELVRGLDPAPEQRFRIQAISPRRFTRHAVTVAWYAEGSLEPASEGTEDGTPGAA